MTREMVQCALARCYESQTIIAVWLPADMAQHDHEIKIDAVWWRVIEVWPHRISVSVEAEQDERWRELKSRDASDE